MALTLDTEFRSLKTAPSLEPAARGSESPGRGKDFARELRQVRNAEEDDAATVVAETSDTAEPEIRDSLPSSFVTAPLPQDIARGETPVETLTVPAPASEAPLSVLAIDRELVRESVSEQQQLPLTPAPGLDLPAASSTPAPGVEQASMIAPPEASPQAGNKSAAAPDEPLPLPAVSAAQSNSAAGLVAAATIPAINPPGTAQRSAASEVRPAQVRAPEAAPEPHAATAASLAETQTADSLPAETIVSNSGATGEKLGDSSGQSGSTATPVTLASSGPAAPQSTVPSAVPAPMAPAQAVITASPAQIVDIVARTAEDGQSDRITVQLDPPELGRVSIDFKFDAQGLQHVTITSETPEAMRQLRQMHSELMQALERQGIAGQNMTFQHQHQQTPQAPVPNPFARAAINDGSVAAPLSSLVSQDNPQGARTLPGGRLDIRL